MREREKERKRDGLPNNISTAFEQRPQLMLLLARLIAAAATAHSKKKKEEKRVEKAFNKYKCGERNQKSTKSRRWTKWEHYCEYYTQFSLKAMISSSSSDNGHDAKK